MTPYSSTLPFSGGAEAGCIGGVDFTPVIPGETAARFIERLDAEREYHCGLLGRQSHYRLALHIGLIPRGRTLARRGCRCLLGIYRRMRRGADRLCMRLRLRATVLDRWDFQDLPNGKSVLVLNFIDLCKIVDADVVRLCYPGKCVSLFDHIRAPQVETRRSGGFCRNLCLDFGAHQLDRHVVQPCEELSDRFHLFGDPVLDVNHKISALSRGELQNTRCVGRSSVPYSVR